MILGYDNHKIVQIVVPNNIEILYRYIQPNQTAIFKHIKHENGRFSLTDRTEILILPDFIDGISSLIDKEDDCQSIAVIYRPVCTTKKRSIVLPSMQVFPTYKFTHLKALNFNSKFRLEGMIIKISPDEPKANYCLNCSTAEKTQICVCGSETCVKTKIELVL